MSQDRHARRSADDYADGFANLLPRGVAWPRDADSVLMKLVAGLATVWGEQADARAADLLEREADPRFTLEMLDAWERAFGLPEIFDSVTPAPTWFRVGMSHVGRDRLLKVEPTFEFRRRGPAPDPTIEDRRAALVAKMTSIGGQSRAFFIGLAATLGYAITITEYFPFMLGLGQCGIDRLGAPDDRFYWTVNVSGFRISRFHLGTGRLGVNRLLSVSPKPRRFRVGVGQVGVDPLLYLDRAFDLEALFRKLKPAHTQVIFNYAAAVEE